jgi:hypothetical protein
MIGFLAVLAVTGALSPFLATAGETRVAPAADPAAPVGANGIIAAEDRRLLSEFTIDGAADQAAVRAGLGATQRLSCGASASLVYRDDVIIFSAHQLLNDDGKLDPDFQHCFFEVARKSGGKVTVERYPLLLATLDYGRLAPESAVDDAWNYSNQNDWAIVRLARPVVGIEPYRLPETADAAVPGDAVTTVSDTTDNWRGSSEPGDRIAQSCHVVETTPGLRQDYPGVMHLDCDVGRGASGSAVLRDAASGRPTYVGTTIAYTGNHCQHVGLTTCFSIARGLDADLIARIEGTTAIRPTARDQALGAAQDGRLDAEREKVARNARAALAAAHATLDDSTGKEVAGLNARIQALLADGRAAETDALFLEAFRLLRDPNQSRPEWLWLFMDDARSMLAQRRQADAFECLRFAFEVAPVALKPYLEIKMAQTAADPAARSKNLREAYLAGGDPLFLVAQAYGELAEIKAGGLPTTDR